VKSFLSAIAGLIARATPLRKKELVGAGILILLSSGALAGQETPIPNGVPASEELVAFKEATRAKYDLKQEAFRNNDVEPIINHFYSPRVISVDPEGNTHIGRDGIRPVYEEVIGSLVNIESFQSFVNGDAGWDWVNFHVSFPPGVDAEPFSFKMLFLWEKIEGEWWSHGEMYVPGAFTIDSE
jgi:ketosteroid isomerase-like protein